jgi:ferric-dicitrate binding protein FerR (iron transport regulator)
MMAMKNNEIFGRLCIKVLTGNINPEESKLLHDWLSLSEENRNEFEKLKSVWEKTGFSGMPESPDIETEWLELNARIRSHENSAGANLYPHEKSGRKFFIAFKPALTAAVLLVLLAAVWLLWNPGTGKPELNSVSTGNSEHKEINFADGSHVLLNSGSSIQFPLKFDEKERNIRLKGEGFFSVAKDGRPFIICTENAAITVLGTKFNVRSRDGKTQVYVKDGRVKLARQNLNSSGVVLLKGELSTVVKNGIPAPPVNADPDMQLGWMEGRLAFNHTPLNEIAREMERFYNVRVVLQDSSLQSYTLTGSFKNSRIEDVLNMVCLALDLDYSQASGSPDQPSGKNEYIIKLKK